VTHHYDGPETKHNGWDKESTMTDQKEKKPRGPRKTFSDKLLDAREAADERDDKAVARVEKAKAELEAAQKAQAATKAELAQIDAMIAAGNAAKATRA
jgi:hypothetical protein